MSKAGYEVYVWSGSVLALISGTKELDGYYEQVAIEYLLTRHKGPDHTLLQRALSAVRNASGRP